MYGESARQRRSNRARILLGSLAVAAGGLLFGAQQSSAAVACTLGIVNDLNITVTGADNVTIARTVDGDFVVTDDNDVPVCVGATVTNVDTVIVTVAGAAADTAAQTVVIDQTNGRFEEGASFEAPGTSSEIEFQIDLGTTATGSQPNDIVRVRGTATADHIVAGAAGINLNVGENSPDADVTLTSVETVQLWGGGGNDVLSGNGGSGAGAVLPLLMQLNGQAGDDQETGGSGADVFDQGGTIAAVATGAGADSGADTVFGGLGVDQVSYEGRTAAVAVSINAVTAGGQGDDGELGEHDNVDVEDMVGGDGDDLFSGTKAPATSLAANKFEGKNGSDQVDYSDRTANLTIDLENIGAGTNDDGEAGEGDNLDDDLERVLGGSGNDNISGASVFTAPVTLSGNNGNDTLTGTANADTLNGGAGMDTLNGGEGGNTLNGDAGADTLNGGSATDTLNGGADADTLNGGVGDDTLNGDAGADTLNGEDGNDTLNGGDGNDTLWGGTATSDTGTNDAASYAGKSANLSLSLDGVANDGDGTEVDNLNGIESLTGGSGNDTISGDNAANTLRGGGGNDTLIGNAGDDTLFGEGGNDTLRGGADTGTLINSTKDTLDGGTETDTADYSDSGGRVTVDLSDTTRQDTTNRGFDQLTDVENLTGSNFNDTLSGNAGVNVITGGDGDDTLAGRAENDTLAGGNGTDTADFSAETVDIMANIDAGTATGAGTDSLTSIANLIGGSGDDILVGDESVNDLAGGDGDDELEGAGAGDTLNGGDGTHDAASYAGSTTAVTVSFQTPNNNTGDADDDVYEQDLASTPTIEDIIGSAQGDTLDGDGQANRISGGGGIDIVNGRGGNDTLRGGAGDDFLSGGGGSDTVDYSPVSTGVVVDLNAPQQATGEGDDSLAGIVNAIGSSGNDTLRGNTSANELDGGLGDDSLVGRGGADTLTGGGGTDTADFSASSATVRPNLLTGTGTDGDAQGDTYTTIENLIGSTANDTLTGSNDANRLEGRGGGDTLIGNDGDDTLVGGAGGDSHDGGVGADLADYSSAGTGLTVDMTNTANNTGDANGDTYTTMENLLGSPQDDTLTGPMSGAPTNAADNVITGGAGTDTVSYTGAGSGVTVNLAAAAPQATGGGGNDTLVTIENVTGSAQNDTIGGNAGNNVLAGGDGTDTLTYAGSAAGVTVNLGATVAQNTGGAGTDTASGFENLVGSDHNDTLLGTSGDNTLDGGAGTGDTVSYAGATAGVSVDLSQAAAQATGGAGSDTLAGFENLIGSPQADTLIGTAGNNVLTGGTGSDTVSYAAATAAVTVDLAAVAPQATGGGGSDTLAGIENVIGSNFQDSLFGDSGANVLSGGDADDSINGRGGNDTENGGAGNDLFRQESAANGGDALNGGDGTQDRVDYSLRTNAVTVTRNGAADDGESGELDNVGNDVELESMPSVPPGAPTGVTATAGNGSATVNWTAPASNGGSEITGYKVTASPGGATASTAGDQRSAVVGGLANGTSYTFTVQAQNVRGFGPASAPSNAVTPSASGTSGTQGYTMVGGDGGIFNFGTSKFFGSMGGKPLNAPVIGLAHTPSGKGYWEVARDGGIFTFGDATFFGSMGGKPLNAPVLGMEPTPSGKGYWLFAADGGIFTFGDATFFGSMGGKPLNAPVVGMAATSTGKGYWLVGSDGGIFTFGDAQFFGSTGGKQINQPVFDMAAGPNNQGYWLVARDGGVFKFGNIGFYGSAANSKPSTVIGMGATPNGNGYWIADDRGFVYAFGDAEVLGDLRTKQLNSPIVGFAAVPKLS